MHSDAFAKLLTSAIPSNAVPLPSIISGISFKCGALLKLVIIVPSVQVFFINPLGFR